MAEGDKAEKAVEGLGHLQAAALEMIKAARAFLDVAEDLVQDPGTAKAVMAAMAAMAQAAAQAGRPHSAGDEERESGVERIPVT
jgi:hypothetical protein